MPLEILNNYNPARCEKCADEQDRFRAAMTKALEDQAAALETIRNDTIEECVEVVLNKYHVKQGPYMELADAIRQRGKELSDEG